MYNPNSLYQNSSYIPYQEMIGMEGYMRPVEIQRAPLEEIECPVIIGITTNKPRIHWTQELHQRFDDAVNELGGLFSATPKNILAKMKVRGLTLDHVRSHLQKARSISRKNISEASGIQVNPAADSHPQLSQGEAYFSTPLDVSGTPSFQADHNGGLGSFSGSSEIQGYNPDSMIVPSQVIASFGYDCPCSFCSQLH